MTIPYRKFAGDVARELITFIDAHKDYTSSDADLDYRSKLESIQEPLEEIMGELSDAWSIKAIEKGLGLIKGQLKPRESIPLMHKNLTIKFLAGTAYRLGHHKGPLSQTDYESQPDHQRYREKAKNLGLNARVEELRPLMEIVLDEIGEPIPEKPPERPEMPATY